MRAQTEVNQGGRETAAVSPDLPEYCVPAVQDKLQEIKKTPAGPYFIHHPASASPATSMVIFLSGGSGGRRSAQRSWSNYLSAGAGVDDFRVVLPYSVDFEYMSEAPRTFGILDEVLACYGGDAGKVHIAGRSNGGHVAFATMLRTPELFATLLGAPGSFPTVDHPAWAKALAGRAVFNGVGARDDDWHPEVEDTHLALAAAGIDSVYVEFPGEGHSVSEEFDESIFFEFWSSH